ncbi:MAG: hypothetical protein ACYDEE_08890 [Ignavibacteriaceae bacterium]
MLDNLLVDFNENLIGLREFVELIDPYLNEKLEEQNKFVQPLIFSAMIKNIFDEKDIWEEGEKEKYLKIQEELSKEIREKYSEIPEIIFEKFNDNKGKDNIDKKPMGTIIKTSSSEFKSRVEIINKSFKHKDLLFTNSLISSLSSVEWYFSQLLHYYYDKYPDSAGIQKRILTLSDLKSFSTISDAEKYLIDIKIDEILRGNFESWITLLKTELSLNLGYLDPMVDELIEIYQRRNLFVHSGGIVNSIYLSKVKEEFKINIKSGAKLNVDKKYLDKAICLLQKAFILIGSELWKKIDPSDSSRPDILVDIVYENLLHSRWDICEGLCLFLLKDKNISPVYSTLAQLNYWLTQKELGKYDSIKDELKKIDYSDKKEIFQLGLYALQGDTKRFMEILPIALDTNQINIERLEEFPILKDIRNTEDYKKFKLESKYFKEPSKEISKVQTVEREN